MQIRRVVVGKSGSGELATAFQLAASGPIGQSSPWCYGNTIPCHTIRYHTIHYYIMPYHDILYHTILYICIPYHVRPYGIHCILYTTQATLLSSYSKARQVLSAHFQMPQAAQLTDPLGHRPQISVSQIKMMQKWRRNQTQRLCSPWTLLLPLYGPYTKLNLVGDVKYLCLWNRQVTQRNALTSFLCSSLCPGVTRDAPSDPTDWPLLPPGSPRLEPSISGSPTCQKLKLISPLQILCRFSLFWENTAGCLSAQMTV